MKPTHYDYVIIGGGVAGISAAKTLREEGDDGSIAILSNESIYPYQRPPLSKSGLRAEVAPIVRFILEPLSYEKLKINLLRNFTAISIDTQKHLVVSSDDREIHYKKLLITTGLSPNKIKIPGFDYLGIHYLYTYSDHLAIHAKAKLATSVLVVGGSFIGLEVTASLAKKGIKVTLLERYALLNQFNLPDVSEYFLKLFEEHDVQVLLNDYPVKFNGKFNVESVETAQGKSIHCDMVVIGAGATPDTSFLNGSGIKLDDGILVDQYLQTNRANIYAAGDVANFYDPILGCRQRVTHWDNALKQGRIVAKNMRGIKTSFQEVPYFYSDVFDISFNVLGLIKEPYERITRGALDSGSFAIFFLRNDIPIALFTLGRPSEETKVMESLIKHKVNLGAIKGSLSDPSFSLSHIPNQNIFILQGGGAFGAFECGAVKALTELGIYPHIVAGVSIGAFNGAIIASNSNNPAPVLEKFWRELAVTTPMAANESLRQMQACNQIAAFGVPNFFKPRWLQAFTGFCEPPTQWTNLYDTSPMKKLLEKYVDFKKLRSSPIRLLISAVNIETSELVIFDSYEQDITPEHIMASGSLPPAFPWVAIDGIHYWDGAIVSNSPLEQVIDRCGSEGKRVYIIDLFPGKRTELPNNLLDVMSRKDEILYSERIRSDVKFQALIGNYQRLVDEVISELPPDKANKIRHRPNFIQLMADESEMKITRILRSPIIGEVSSKDYDFSEITIEKLKKMGYELALRTVKAN